MSTPEGALVKQIMAAIAKEYPKAWIFKTVGNPYQIAGVPDLIICVGGRFVALEVKARRSRESTEHALGRTTPRQVQTLEAIRQAGGVSAVVTSPREAIREIIRSSIHAVYDQISSSWQTSPDAAGYMQSIEQALDAFQGEKEDV